MGELVDLAVDVAAVAAAHADETEAGRRLAAPVVDALRGAGLFRLCVPAAYGGLEAHPSVLVDCIEAVAQGDGAAGWCLMIGATTGAAGAYLPRAGAEAIYADAAGVTGGVVAPNGRGAAVDGGVEVSGRWAWGSGSQHCSWLGLGTITDAGHRLAFLPADEVEVVDTWHSMGLRGTGSHDLVVDARLVPDERLADIFGPPVVDTPLYAFPLLGLLAVGVAAVGLGIATHALDELLDLAGSKTPSGTARTLAERSAVQGDIARADALVRAGRLLLHDAIDAAWAPAVGGGAIPPVERAALRQSATTAARWSADAVDLVHGIAGGTAVQERAGVLARCFRDAHTLTQHVMVGAPTLDAVGRVLLGLDDGPSL
jgi:alkylation response protein AidB-like acyl-CoA dehydrogenase